MLQSNRNQNYPDTKTNDKSEHQNAHRSNHQAFIPKGEKTAICKCTHLLLRHQTIKETRKGKDVEPPMMLPLDLYTHLFSMYTQIAYRRVAYPCHDHRGPIAKTTTRVGLVDCVTTRQTRWSCQTRWACRLRLNECLIDKLQGIACATDGADNRETIKTQQAFCEYVATLHSDGHTRY